MGPGKYLLHRSHHFVAFEIWSDLTCILRPTRKVHIGAVRDWTPELVEGYTIFKVNSLWEDGGTLDNTQAFGIKSFVKRFFNNEA